MRAILQRVTEAKVEVEAEAIGAIKTGWMVLLGVTHEDNDSDVQYIADKIENLRGFKDDDGKMNLSVGEVNGEVLVVSQFTLYGDCRKGRRPGFTRAASPDQANALYEQLISLLKNRGLTVATGQFQAYMQVSLCNDGPVTFLLDSSKEL